MKAFERIKTMTINEKALELHEKWNGKLDTVSKVQVKTREDLALAYTPGVAEPCKVIAKDKRSGSCIPLHHQVQHCSRCLRRKRRSGTWQYRTVSSYAGYGRKSRSV